MKKLSPKLRVICALEAAKIALPIWEEDVSKNKTLSKERKEAPIKAIKLVEKWLEGQATRAEIKVTANIVNTTANTEYTTIRAAAYAAAYTINATDYTVNYNSYNNATYAVDEAYDACANAYGFYACAYTYDFYANWWAKCITLIQKEFQDKYDNLCTQIVEDI